MDKALVASFGSGFPLLRREDTLNTLWNGTSDRNGVYKRFEQHHLSDRTQHPIALLACGPGTGKSRFLQEVGEMLREKANSCTDENIKKAFSNMLAVNITYGNASSASQEDVTIGGEASIAIRLLYEYFISTNSANIKPKVNIGKLYATKGIKSLKLWITVNVICSDFISRGVSTGPAVLVLGIDEVSILYRLNKETFRQVVYAVGSQSCTTTDPFFIPILAGTIQGPVEDIAKESTYRLLLPPLPLLTDDDVINIGSKLHLTEDNKILRLTEDYLKNDILFRCSISDIGGMPRAVEIFYNKFIYEMGKIDIIPEEDNKLTETLQNVDVVTLMKKLLTELGTLYPFNAYMDFMTPVLAKAILEIPVDIDDNVKVGEIETSYKQLRSAGIINLEPIKESENYYIYVSYRFCSNFINAKQEISWGGWKQFNMQFFALRLCLFSVLGIKTISLEELFLGAEFHYSGPNFKIKIPDYCQVSVHHLLDEFPVHNIVNDDTGTQHIVSQSLNKVFINDNNSLIDGFTCLPLLQSRNLEQGNIALSLEQYNISAKSLSIGFQMKLADEKHSKELDNIDQKLIDKESINFVKTNNILKEYCKDLDCIFGIFTSHHRSSKMILKDEVDYIYDKTEKGVKEHINIFIIHKENFRQYYGYTFVGRAQFSISSSLYINSAPPHHIKHIPGVGPRIYEQIIKERKRKRFENEVELISRIPGFPYEELSSIIF
ncbi:hypothetical protein BC937DRAFT_93035 [Endogone sp. FLAS-F59071]|nr:hypothetical protein BC937DRAFT_93035 [Endogone sp. FLAS-F59071]|eukprot:RUS15009.1 hypothetical protein BC937DRAFT_93035 [Endogone sp. FLAS-F59071]